MRVEVLFFASLREAAGTGRALVDLEPGATLRELRAVLPRQFPGLEAWMECVAWARNAEYCAPDQALCEGDEIALVPPVSGGQGAPLAVITGEPLNLDRVCQHALAQLGHEAGALCCFLGVVRCFGVTSDGQKRDGVEFLEYETYEPLAHREMTAIAREAHAKFGAFVAIEHRVGKLGLGQPSVAIAAASAHRAAAFEACRYAIEELKKRVPIWKREVARDGSSWVEGTAVPPPTAPAPQEN